ncbi:TniQ family protein [Phaeobacter gallaeciensis]|uniref:TniQ family protein n=1 Tax=Phaeobacter gallaeciensis TaxID=60890 RepID=UPI00237F9AC2|nr:TniQ family protein [Phaeobacter gallaeciensis]MDE4306342.1 TniQ family protein [Phaeobacter gallaeciensis]MDE4310789.1 TniQ family protein [Phaeobacter gallaeciensis]MDE4315263.1 TniQ family protein [Phaeobacter gallaeciensis]MDE4319735.1 TniQ family protein [Phaeobacter gallaeciensis]MDE4324180.1 TniQ family protein [Phaeobacter gallaeciensis]
MTTPLALMPAIKDRETAFSYVSRMAAMNGVDTAGFCTDMGLSLTKIINGVPEDLMKLAALCDSDVEDLKRWTPLYFGNRAHTFRGHRVHAKAIKDTTVRGCPVCLREDAEASPDNDTGEMYIRGHWLFRPVSLCVKHHHPLVPLWSERQVTLRYDSASRLAEIAQDVRSEKLDTKLREPREYDQWIEARLLDQRTSSWLDQFELYAAAHFCELLGRAILAFWHPKSNKFTPEKDWLSFDMGFHFANKGEDRIRTALTELQTGIGEPTDGPKKKFGALYDRLAFDLKGEEYAPFRKLLRDHITATWPLGPGDDLMGEPVLERRVHSVRTAARELGMDPRRLRKLLVDVDLVRPIETGKDDQWELFDAKKAQPHLDRLNTLVSAKDFQSALNMSRNQFELLREEDYFAPAVDNGDHKPLWDVRAAHKFFEKLLTGAEPIYVPMHNWGDLPKIAQSLQISPGTILSFLERGKVQRVGRHMTREGYRAILVTHDEIERLLNRPDAPGISIELFARQCGLKPSAAMRLVREAHIPSTEGRHPKSGVPQRFLAPADIAAFHDRFVTLRGLAVELGLSWQALRPKLADAGVEPFSPDGQDYGALFERGAANAVQLSTSAKEVPPKKKDDKT